MKPIVAEGWIASTKKGQPMSKWRSAVTPRMISGTFVPQVWANEIGVYGRGVPLKVRVTIGAVKP